MSLFFVLRSTKAASWPTEHPRTKQISLLRSQEGPKPCGECICVVCKSCNPVCGLALSERAGLGPECTAAAVRPSTAWKLTRRRLKLTHTTIVVMHHACRMARKGAQPPSNVPDPSATLLPAWRRRPARQRLLLAAALIVTAIPLNDAAGEQTPAALPQLLCFATLWGLRCPCVPRYARVPLQRALPENQPLATHCPAAAQLKPDLLIYESGLTAVVRDSSFKGGRLPDTTSVVGGGRAATFSNKPGSGLQFYFASASGSSITIDATGYAGLSFKLAAASSFSPSDSLVVGVQVQVRAAETVVRVSARLLAVQSARRRLQALMCMLAVPFRSPAIVAVSCGRGIRAVAYAACLALRLPR